MRFKNVLFDSSESNWNVHKLQFHFCISAAVFHMSNPVLCADLYEIFQIETAFVGTINATGVNFVRSSAAITGFSILAFFGNSCDNINLCWITGHHAARHFHNFIDQNLSIHYLFFVWYEINFKWIINTRLFCSSLGSTCYLPDRNFLQYKRPCNPVPLWLEIYFSIKTNLSYL